MRLSNHSKRLWTLAILLGLGVLALLYRLLDLSVIDQKFLKTQINERTVRTVVIPTYRGIITDRNNRPLAVSTPVYALWIDPKKIDFSPSLQNLLQLSRLINIPVNTINLLLLKNKRREFIYLKRDISPPLSEQIKNLNIKGLFLEKQYRRFYPDGETSAQIIGFTNIDDQGQEGIELQYNQWLQGQSGLKKVLKDRYGQEAANLSLIRPPIPGHDLILSIDSRLQYLAYQELLKGAAEFGAVSGSIVILNIHTGEILAMANVPSYNPNNRAPEKNGNYRNRAVTDIFEPGSTIKTFAMTTALLSGKYHPGSLINTHPGYWYVNGKKIQDEHNQGVISLTRILQVSSNVGISKIMLSLPSAFFLNFLHKMGFAYPAGIHFPGENSGLINKAAAHSPFVYATVSFGYAISVNLLQLAHAYATLANNGLKIPLSLLKLDSSHILSSSSQQVITPKAAAEIREMLEYVLKQGGTATAARVYDYRVTGKTGTTRILGPHGYEKNAHNSIFVGIAPATHPELVVAVMLHAPSKKAYLGGFVAGPIFSKVMGDSLRILNVAPDNIQPQT